MPVCVESSVLVRSHQYTSNVNKIRKKSNISLNEWNHLIIHKLDSFYVFIQQKLLMQIKRLCFAYLII